MKPWNPILLVLLVLCLAPAAPASWRIEAERLTFFRETQTLVAEGQVVVRGEETTIFCSRARYEAADRRLVFWGPLRIVSREGDLLEGSFAWLDLDTHRGEVDRGHLFLARNRVHILAQRLEQTGPRSYRAERALITTCDVSGDPSCQPDWSFRSRRVTVSPDGQARARHVTFNVKPVPLLYSPYVSFSVRRDRQSGFLFPRLVHGSREGFGLEWPFFWNVNDSLDFTFYPYYTGKRGFMSGVEGRYALGREQKGVLRVRYLNDRKEDHDYNHDGLVRTNDRRYWITGKFDHLLAPSWEAHLDLDLLSDRDFLYEFAGGPLGFRSSHHTYLKRFGRGLDEINSHHRRSMLWVNHPWGHYFFLAQAAYYDSQVKTQDETLMPLPQLSFYRLTAPLLGPLNFSTRTGYTYWWREEGYRGHRLELYPELSLNPVLWRPLDLRLAYRLRSTFYAVDWGGERGTEGESRKLHEVDLTGSFKLSRLYHFGFRHVRWLKHTLRPEVRYFYRSREDQDDLPWFVLEDRLESVNRLEWRLVQFITAREERPDGVRYFDLVRLWLSQSYDFRHAPRGLESRKAQRRRWSDLLLEAEVKFLSNFYLRGSSSYNFYGLGLVSTNVSADLRNQRGEYLGFDYRWDRARDVHQLNFRTRKEVLPRLFLRYAGEYSFQEEELVSSTLGLTYEARCWTGTLSLYHNPDETRFSLYFDLLGIGGFGR